MENEEKEDLLLEVTESEEEPNEKEEIDYFIEKKILDFIQKEKSKSESSKKTLIFLTTCLLVFLSSSALVIILPIYLRYTSATSISTYSKLVTLSLINAVFFVIAHVVGVLSKCGSHNSSNFNLLLGDVLKISFLLSVGSITVFWLADENYVSCHLKDPLKGCSVVFSLLFYFIFSRKKMSLERTFCAITIVVGVFVSVDFGICDKFQCYGSNNLTEVVPHFHFLYVILYLLAHGVWVLHFTVVEVCWTSLKDSNSNLNVSILTHIPNSINSGTKTSIQSLSIICQEEPEVSFKSENLPKIKQNKKLLSDLKWLNSKITSVRDSDNSLDNSLGSSSSCKRTQLSLPNFSRFPITSTPNNEMNGLESWTSGHCYDVALWQHIICFLFVLGLCWIPTISYFHDGKGKLLVEVISDTLDSFQCHFGWSSNQNCNHLSFVTIFLSIFYVVLILSSIELLKCAQSTVTVVSLLMPALPVSSLFWSLFQFSRNKPQSLEFNPEITGEAVCAVLGLPIIGIGIVLLLKSHIREFNLVV